MNGSVLDFLDISISPTKDGMLIEPLFMVRKTKDLLIRGGDFYAIWNEDTEMWTEVELDAVNLIDKELERVTEKYKKDGVATKTLYLRNSKNRKIKEWHTYCQSDMRDNFNGRMLNSKLIFSNTPVRKEDYASFRLPYPLEKGPTDSWDKILSVLYSPEEQMKIEWAIGCIISGDSKKTQKCIIMYGDRGTGKSTIIDIIQKLLSVSEDQGYCKSFSAEALGSSSNAFSLEAFKDNPLVAIEHESKLTKIDDNTRLNALISHESMLVNVKHKSAYSAKFNTFLIMASNNPVKITDARSGLLRRLIDISPTGNRIPRAEYDRLKEAVGFELSGIAYKCLDIYKKNKHLYDDYIPTGMISATNDLYNFIYCSDEYAILRSTMNTTLQDIYPRYKAWCEAANIRPLTQTVFKEELKAYFTSFKDRDMADDNKTRVRSKYTGFKYDSFDNKNKAVEDASLPPWLQLKEQKSKLDILLADCPAQYATEDEKPSKRWDGVTERLCDIYTDRLHYVRPEIHHIVIDLDICGEDGSKSLEANLKAAATFPPTYAEVSKSGKALHLHYIYTGDPETLSSVYAPNIEIKVFSGKQSLRRKLTICNNLDISTISSGLPKKEKKKMIDISTFKTVEDLQKEISINLRKGRVPSTVQSMSLIQSDLEKAYNSGLSYDLTNMQNVIMAFAQQSKNSFERATQIARSLKLKSKDMEEEFSVSQNEQSREMVDISDITIFDFEVFSNYCCVAYEVSPGNPTVIIFPTPEDIEMLAEKHLGGYNCKHYDNNIAYAIRMGYSTEMLYALSSNLTSNDKRRQRDSMFGSSKDFSYIDIFEMLTKKQSLKKWEIELKRKRVRDKDGKFVYPYAYLEHIEANVDWTQPLPESMFKTIAEYCMNDVKATRAVLDANKGDYEARLILSDMSGLPVNESTNAHTTKFIFGDDKNPQRHFQYYFMGIPKSEINLEDFVVPALECDWEYTVFDKQGRAFFPDYTFEYDPVRKQYVSMYRGEEIGEGGYVFAQPGIYHNVVTFDVASMHPSSVEALNYFGDIYTKHFSEIKQARIAIKHGDIEKAKTLLGGILIKYLDDKSKLKPLAAALKIAINSVYGLTAAKFPNSFKDERNVDNIVAKRGALFMVNLKHEVQRRGFTVVHIKTDSIKVENPSPEIAQFISDYGQLYGYQFEIEAEYERICLINDAVYIAKLKEPEIDKDTGEEIWWSATGTQFAVPFVYKTLFSHQDITYYDMCETFSVTTRMYLDMNEGLPDVTALEKEYKKTGNEDLLIDIRKGHNYEFVGRVGEFTPVTNGGGILLRASDTGYSSVGGTKGYRWLESDKAKILIDNEETSIDISYYNNLVDKAKDAISEFGDFYEFVS